MTANPFANLLRDVPRYRVHPKLPNLMFNSEDGRWLPEADVLAALARAMGPDDLVAEAGKVLEGVTPGPWTSFGHEEEETPGWYDLFAPTKGDNWKTQIGTMDEAADARFTAWCREGVPALLARLAAQEAQIKGLEATVERFARAHERHLIAAAETRARAEAAETALATVTKERDELRASIAWVDEVYPERIEAGGAGIQITWEEFNAMQAAIGVTVDKRIGGPEGKAVHNQRLRSALAAERAKVAKLVEAGKALGLREIVAGWNGEGKEKPYTPHPAHLWATIKTTCGAVYALDAAITEAGHE